MVVADQCSLRSCLLYSLQKYNQFVWQMRENRETLYLAMLLFVLAWQDCPPSSSKGTAVVVEEWCCLLHWVIEACFMSSSLLNSSQFWWPTVSRILICMFAVILEGGGGEGCGLKRLGKFGCFGLESLMGGERGGGGYFSGNFCTVLFLY